MSKYRINADKTNRLDYCPHCEEIWLDDGEWQLVEGLVLAGDFTQRVHAGLADTRCAPAVTDADGRATAARVVGRGLRRAWCEFAEWLQAQPAKHGNPGAPVRRK